MHSPPAVRTTDCGTGTSPATLPTSRRVSMKFSDFPMAPCATPWRRSSPRSCPTSRSRSAPTSRHCYAERRERFQHECRLRTDDGSTKWVVLRGLIVYDGEVPQRLVGGVRDITERLEFQNRLNEIENKRAILARYFSPNMVDDLMQTGGRLNETRTQLVTVLFVDIIGFTKVSAQLSRRRCDCAFARLPQHPAGSRFRPWRHARQVPRRWADGDLRHAAGRCLRCHQCRALRADDGR